LEVTLLKEVQEWSDNLQTIIARLLKEDEKREEMYFSLFI